MRASSYIVAVPVPDTETALLFHGYSGAVDLVSSEIASLLAEQDASNGGIGKSLSERTLQHLTTRGYVTDRSAESERAYVTELGMRVHAVMRKHASPGFLVVPTYSCNLRCTYCYEKDLKAKGRSWLEQRMSDEMIEAALDAMERIARPGHRQRCMTFYGGEPLQKSNGPVIRHLYERAREKGFRQFSAITNAVDLHHYTDILGKDNAISFLQVTLDGPPAVHDARRCLPDGRGTFERIARNIGLAMKQGTRISLRVNVDRKNAHRVKWLIDFFRTNGWTETSLFRAYCSPVHETICGRPSVDGFVSHQEMCQAIRGKEEMCADQRGSNCLQTDPITHAVQTRLLAHLSKRQDFPPWRTAFCGSNMAMYLFDPFGDMYPCWEVIGHPEHRIGQYGPGVLELDAQAVHQWHHRSVVQIPACRSCPYLFFCGGGCEAFALRATGRLDQPNCSEFPRHFQKAALNAYRQWVARQEEETPLTGS